MSKLAVPVVYDFQNARDYLRAVYKYCKQTQDGFSYDSWSSEMGIRSRSYLRALVNGEKPLQEHLLPSLLKGLHLSAEEMSYFALLLRYDCAPTPELKHLYGREMLHLWNIKARGITPEDFTEFLSDPTIPAMFTYLSFDDVAADIPAMARDLGCDIERAQKALRYLVWNKLVEGSMQDDGKVVYKTIQPFFSIPSLPANTHLKMFHAEGVRQSQAAISMPSTDRKLYSAFFALSDEQFGMVQQLVQDFNQRLLSILESDRIRGKKIYRFNQQIFPVSERVEK